MNLYSSMVSIKIRGFKMTNQQNNEKIIEKVVTDYMNIQDPKEKEKWEKYFIFIMLN